MENLTAKAVGKYTLAASFITPNEIGLFLRIKGRKYIGKQLVISHSQIATPPDYSAPFLLTIKLSQFYFLYLIHRNDGSQLQLQI